MNAPYGQTFVLQKEIPDVECWNKTDNGRYTLPVGLHIKLEHVNDATHTTCMAQDPERPGEALELFPGCYRWIIPNKLLGESIGVPMPETTDDIVGDMIAYENGAMTPEQEAIFLRRLQRARLEGKLQGHYGRAVSRL